MTDVVHGTWAGYHTSACRCLECRAYESKRKADYRTEAKRAFAAGEVDPPHGVASTNTVYGCTCDLCRTAEADRRRRYPRYR